MPRLLLHLLVRMLLLVLCVVLVIWLLSWLSSITTNRNRQPSCRHHATMLTCVRTCLSHTMTMHRRVRLLGVLHELLWCSGLSQRCRTSGSCSNRSLLQALPSCESSSRGS
jgi:hypothetical protein